MDVKTAKTRVISGVVAVAGAVGLASAGIAAANGGTHGIPVRHRASARLHRSAAGSAPTLMTVSASDLAARGYVLGAPAVAAQVSRQQAEQTALSAPLADGGAVRESVLAQISSAVNPSADGHTAWVVSVATPSGTYRAVGGKILKIDYYVVLVDAQTGARLAAFGRAG